MFEDGTTDKEEGITLRPRVVKYEKSTISNDLYFMSKPAESSKLEKKLATIEKIVKVTRASENERTDDL